MKKAAAEEDETAEIVKEILRRRRSAVSLVIKSLLNSSFGDKILN